MPKVSESQENLMDEANEKLISTQMAAEVPLLPEEKKFLLYVERGDCASVKRHVEQFKDCPTEFKIDCVDPLNRSALITAIENENVELINILLDNGIKVKDALLHAIKEEYVEAVEILLEWEEKYHKKGEPYSWEAVDLSLSTFTPDITPLVLAAHMNNYEIVKILLDRGATLPTPHDVRCGCDECVESSEQDCLRHSQARINAYRALSSPSLIALSSRDPLLTAFELSWELKRLSRMESEFRMEYNEMRAQVQTFSTSLLDHARTSEELNIILNHNPTGVTWEPGEPVTLERLKLAIKYKQKQFVAHPSVQQMLASIWYDGLPGFRRKSMPAQLLEVGKLGAMFPVYSTIYMLAPESSKGVLMSKPFVKFICHSSSYSFFLLLLCAASQRIEYLLMEIIGTDTLLAILADWKRRDRGSLPGFVECGVILYIFSMINWEMRSLWSGGLLDYVSDLWNIIDFVSNIFYTSWIALRFTSVYITWREYWNGWNPWYPREDWHPFDPMLISEGMFSAGMILSFLKLVHIFSINPHLGPLQISLGRMIVDIIKFFFIYTLVLFAFGCGMNQLLWYYADLEKRKCYNLPNGLADFDNQDKACSIWRRFANMFETSQSLFWAGFGLVDLLAFELTGIKSFTRFWALLMFGSYSVINIIVLLNLLIAMMSNSYQIISERADVEWKFARSHLWVSYMEDDENVPIPFNLVPSPAFLMGLVGMGKKKIQTGSVRERSREKAELRHSTVMRLLVRRYVTAEQRKRDDFGITEDDVMEIRQDISTLRFELINIFRDNSMKTPNVDPNDNTLHGKKGKVMERRLLKDFQIGFVETAVNDAITNELKPVKDVFGKIARAIGKKNGGSKRDWNASVRNKSRKDPIGSTSEMVDRRSRQSLRQHVINDEFKTVSSLDPKKLVEYNPKLVDVSPAARVAYAKFKLKKLKHDQENLPEETNDDNVFEDSKKSATTSSIRPRPVAASNLITTALISKKSSGSVSSDKKEVVLQMEPEPSTSGNSQGKKQSIRSARAPAQPSGQPAGAIVKTPESNDKVSKPPSSPSRPATPPPPPIVKVKSASPSTPRSATPSIPEKSATKTKQSLKIPKAKKEEEIISPTTQVNQGSGRSKISGRVVSGWL